MLVDAKFLFNVAGMLEKRKNPADFCQWGKVVFDTLTLDFLKKLNFPSFSEGIFSLEYRLMSENCQILLSLY